MQEINPFLWFDTEGEEAAKLYTSIFNNGRITSVTKNSGGPGPKDKPFMVEFEIAGRHFNAMNAGPAFTFSIANSLFVTCETDDEIERAWKALSDGGEVRMPLQEYPFSKKYAWVEDKWGVNWQLNLTNTPQTVAPAFLFVNKNQGRCEEALNFWTKEFPNSSIGMIARYEEGEQGPVGQIKYSSFMLNGLPFVAMDSGAPMPGVEFTPAVSMFVNCDTQQEVDRLWDEMVVDGGRHDQCGWLQDRFGVSWQIVPTALGRLMRAGDPARSANVMKTVMGMNKLVISELEAAYEAV